jgi:2,4-dienoyl-CoA reductase-like NADH-dependent reductase (Old Yellow Enzyme family)
MSNDPLLRPYQLKHLTLRNRIMITSHEPAYPEDGMPKARYRAYHVERAKAGVALTMTAGSASVSRDSPPAFNNILVWKDEVVGWMKQLVDECHDHGAAVMIQLTHLGRRTRWDTGDWLPVLAPSHEREAAHRAFPKRLEDWDMARVIGDFADAAERMKAAGVDGVELEAYGHLLEQFWSPLTNQLDGPYGGDLDNRLGIGGTVDRDADHVGSGLIEVPDLSEGGLDVLGRGGGHALDGDGCSVADGERADGHLSGGVTRQLHGEGCPNRVGSRS